MAATRRRISPRVACVPVVLVAVLLSATPAAADAGAVDTRFGNHGQVVTKFSKHGAAQSVAMDGNRIVVAGTIFANSGHSSVALARYLPDGSLDQSFGGTGKVVIHVGSKNASNSAGDVAVTRGGRVLLTVASSLLTYHLYLLRYLPDGTLDPSFGTGGSSGSIRPWSGAG